jgi:hypothetical protein
MKISELRKALSSFESLLEQTRADSELLSDLARLNSWLAQFDKQDVSELCGNVGVPESPPRTAKSVASVIDSALVDDYAASLAGLESDRSSLQDVLSQMKSDKRIRVAEASAIAQRYVGGTSKYKSKADAIKEIKLRFEAGLRAGQRLRAASDIY